jgi:hypothetical protein
MKIAIDFDGVIHDYKHPLPGARMGPPIEGAHEAIWGYVDAGHEVVVFTQRGDKPEHVLNWLFFYEFPKMEVTNIKGAFDLIIDDRAVTFYSWEKLTFHSPGAIK